MSDQSFASKRVLLTGGSAGIGEQCALKLSQQGASVVVVDRNPCNVPGVTFIQGDLGSAQGVDAVLGALGDLDGPFDALLNIAGLPPREGNEALMYQVNFFALRQLTMGLMDRLADSAAIVNVASLAGAQWMQNVAEVKQLMAMGEGTSGSQAHEALGLPSARAYALTKEAVIAWTVQQTAQGLPRGIRMNSVSPAAVATGILDDFVSAFGEQVAKNLARVGRASEADEVADLILFLAAEQSKWIKGVDMVIDGGISAIRKTAVFEP